MQILTVISEDSGEGSNVAAPIAKKNFTDLKTIEHYINHFTRAFDQRSLSLGDLTHHV